MPGGHARFFFVTAGQERENKIGQSSRVFIEISCVQLVLRQ
jgi:hypothetical protein